MELVNFVELGQYLKIVQNLKYKYKCLTISHKCLYFGLMKMFSLKPIKNRSNASSVVHIWSCWLEGVALFGAVVVGLVVEMREHSGGKRAGQWESSKVSCLLRQMSPEFRFSFFAPSLDLQRLCVE